MLVYKLFLFLLFSWALSLCMANARYQKVLKTRKFEDWKDHLACFPVYILLGLAFVACFVAARIPD